MFGLTGGADAAGRWELDGHESVLADGTRVTAHRPIGPAGSIDELLDSSSGLTIGWSDGAGTYRIARDRFGEAPLHYGYRSDGSFRFSSRIADLIATGARPRSIRWVPPGATIAIPEDGEARLERQERTKMVDTPEDRSEAAQALREAFSKGVARCMADAPAVLLSGGLDSAAIVALAIAQGTPPAAVYTARHSERSGDLANARRLAADLSIDLVEVDVPPPTAADMARVVETIEMPHKAQVEIAWLCQHIGARIRDDGHRTVVCGEGSDEMFGSYGTAYYGIKEHGWHGYRRRLYMGQHRKNFARIYKAFTAHELNPLLPFTEPDLVHLALSLPRSHVAYQGNPKAILADAVTPEVPDYIRNRQKAAFQTEAGISDTITGAISNPPAFYRTHFETTFQGTQP